MNKTKENRQQQDTTRERTTPKRISANRIYKARIFEMLFSDKKELLGLYNATRKTNYTDPELLEITGGIVRGMSGSPILQNGKIVGAVTHVFIKDPTRGYGIFIENMLEKMKK